MTTTVSIFTTNILVPSTTASPNMEASQTTQLQLILIVSVVALLAISILLTTILIGLLLAKVARRIKSKKFQSNKTPKKSIYTINEFNKLCNDACMRKYV